MGEGQGNLVSGDLGDDHGVGKVQGNRVQAGHEAYDRDGGFSLNALSGYVDGPIKSVMEDIEVVFDLFQEEGTHIGLR